MLLVVLVVLGLALAVYRGVLAWRLHAELAQDRRAGLPDSLPQLAAVYLPPSGANAANLYLEAFAAYTPALAAKGYYDRTLGDLETPRTWGAFRDDLRYLVTEGDLAENARALALLHRAAAAEGECRYPLDLASGFAADVTHLTRVRQGVRLLAIEARQHMLAGDGTSAVRAIGAILALARSLRREPLLFSQLARISGEEAALDSLERLLGEMVLSEADLTALDRRLESEDHDQMRRAVIGERCCGLMLMAPQNYPLVDQSGKVLLWPALYRAGGALARERLAFLAVMRACLEAAEAPFPQRVAMSNAALQRAEALPRVCVVARWFALPVAHALQRDLRLLARLRAARVALAVERHCAARGSLPATLADLVPEYLPVAVADPYDGAPLRYRRRKTGYVIYSVGEDGTDGGGAPRDPGSRSGDITFTVER